jgi:hypothetical protein
LNVFGTASDEGDDGNEHETSGNDKSDRVAVSAVETLKFAQNWRNESRHQRTGVDRSVEKREETGELLSAFFSILEKKFI